MADARLRRSLPRIVLATLVMGAALWLVADRARALVRAASGGSIAHRGALAVLVGAGLLVYVIAVLVLGVFDRRQLRRLSRRSPSTGPA